jgi:uncharacterized GH25 family protein
LKETRNEFPPLENTESLEESMRKTALAFLILAGIAVVSISISAHDFWLVPEKFRIAAGDSVVISANTGMDFPNSLSAVTPDRIGLFKLVGVSGEESINEFAEQGNSLLTHCSFEKPGTYVIAASLIPKEIRLTGKEFNEYLLADGLPHIYELRKKEGILDKAAVEYYSKYPKTIIQVGKKVDDSPTKPIGLPIEIIPNRNPYGMQKGEELAVTVLFRGKPLAGAEIAWSYPGWGEEFAGSTKTDEKGLASIPLIKAGPYVIRLTHMEWVKKPTHEWESYWTSLTFEVGAEKNH